MIITTAGSKRKMVGRLFSVSLLITTKYPQKEIGIDETEIRSMYECGKLSKVNICQFLVVVPSNLMIYSLLLNNSR